jgi:hypothetical protein
VVGVSYKGFFMPDCYVVGRSPETLSFHVKTSGDTVDLEIKRKWFNPVAQISLSSDEARILANTLNAYANSIELIIKYEAQNNK